MELLSKMKEEKSIMLDKSMDFYIKERLFAVRKNNSDGQDAKYTKTFEM